MNIELINKIKKTLRVFRFQLSIPLASLKIDPQVFQYLKYHRLIDFDDYNKAYVIVPRGFNWDVDTHSVRMPTIDENIMERDQELEIKEEL